MDLDGKTIIITGATSGVGKETAISLAKQNALIVLPVRNIVKGEKVKKEIEVESGNTGIYIMKCDLASFDSIRNFVVEFKKRFKHLHILINNAGTWENERKESDDGIELTFAVNHLAPFLLTGLLLDVMHNSSTARVINVSSEAHRAVKMDFSDLEGKKKFGGFRAYGRSKLANILFTRHLASLLDENEITVNSLHPGGVATNLYDKLNPVLRWVAKKLMISPRKGAETPVYLASSPEVEGITGKYFKNRKITKPSPAARDDRSAERLWELSREYTGF